MVFEKGECRPLGAGGDRRIVGAEKLGPATNSVGTVQWRRTWTESPAQVRGEMKDLMNKVTEAKKAAEAALGASSRVT
jgi:hypothetical protein